MKRRFIVEMETALSSKAVAEVIKLLINSSAGVPITVTNVKTLLLTTLENLDAVEEEIDLEDRSFTIEPSNEARR